MGVIFSIHFSFVLATSLLSYLQIGTSDLLGGAKNGSRAFLHLENASDRVSLGAELNSTASLLTSSNLVLAQSVRSNPALIVYKLYCQ